MRFVVVIAALGLGCGPTPSGDRSASPPPTSDGWVDPAADDDWSHLIDEAESAAPMTAAEVEQALNAALALGIPHMGEIFSRYYDLMVLGDETCPGSALVGGFEVFGSCTAASGVVFSGVSSLEETDGRVYADDEWVAGEYSIRTSPADYVITRTDGTALEAGGFIQFQRTPDGDIHRWTVGIEGSWRDTAATGWLGEGISAGILMGGTARPGEAGKLDLDGSYSVGSAALTFDTVVIEARECPDGIERGSLSLRSGGGALVTVDFSTCSECGVAALADGTALGEVCIDPGPLFEAVPSSGWIP